jgi:Fe-S-cluster containining protein
MGSTQVRRCSLDIIIHREFHLPDQHPIGLLLGPNSSRCINCAWSSNENNSWTCIAVNPESTPKEIQPDWQGCELWEAPLTSCDPCGACCREAFDSVPVTEHDLAQLEQPERWVRNHSDGWRDLQRSPSPSGHGSRCKALYGNGEINTPYRCRIYQQRPTNCRDLEMGSEACLTARRRVFLSPWSPNQRPEGHWATATACSDAKAKKPR